MNGSSSVPGTGGVPVDGGTRSRPGSAGDGRGRGVGPVGGEREATFREDTALPRCRTTVSVVNPIRWLSRALPCLAILVIAGCDMDMQKEPRTSAPPPPAEPEVCAGQPVATRQDWAYDVDSDGDEELDFTSYERDALDRLHAEGWNGNGVEMVIYDFFPEDGSPSHGTAVANVARYYAPNAIFVHRDTQDERGYSPDGDLSRLYIVNSSVGLANPEGQDRLPVDQSRAVRDNSTSGSLGELLVWGAGNVSMALPGDDPANAIPAMLANRFVEVYAEEGWLHAKSGAVIAGAVDYRAADDGWVLSHDSSGYSARGGNAARLHRRPGRQSASIVHRHFVRSSPSIGGACRSGAEMSDAHLRTTRVHSSDDGTRPGRSGCRRDLRTRLDRPGACDGTSEGAGSHVRRL